MVTNEVVTSDQRPVISDVSRAPGKQRQQLLQSNAPDMRALALSHLLSRISSRYENTTKNKKSAGAGGAGGAGGGVAAVARKVLPSIVKVRCCVTSDE